MREKLATGGVGILFAVLSTGCSALFVTSPPDNVAKLPPQAPVECTTSTAAPWIDTAVTTFQVVRTILAAKASSSDYAGAPISRDVDLAAGLVLATAFGVSAGYGFSTTSSCDDAKSFQAARLNRERQSERERQHRVELELELLRRRDLELQRERQPKPRPSERQADPWPSEEQTE